VYTYAFTPVNTRPSVPSVEGSLKVASFNVLNYFLTIDTTASNDVGTCGPSGTLDCRGADSADELLRQRTKMLAALSAINADVFGFMEMENSTGVEPLADIVANLPGYDFIDTGVVGTDAIRVGIIYKVSTVTPVGDFAILNSSVDPRFIDTRNRPALAQTFKENATGASFTVVVNHLKSKGSGCGPGDDDTTTGQGNCNGTRTQAAEALVDWLASDPTGTGEEDVLIIGDLNSYAKEDPIVALQNGGYTDMVAAFGGPNAYGYVFDGQLGYLDHALANSTLVPQVADVAEWHINADEIPLFDYNDDVRSTGEAAFEEESDTLPLYEPNAFRTSDHDPVIVGLNLTILNSIPDATDDTATTNEDTSVTVSVLANDTDSDNDTLTVTAVTQGANGTVVLNGDNTVTYTPNADFNGTDSFTYTVSDGQGGTDTATVNVTVDSVNDAPSFTSGGNVTVAEDSGAYSAAWATNISAGASNESGQMLTFLVSNNTNAALFSTAPAVASDGTLSFTPAANANGTANITVTLADNGGTANGGQDTSASVTFTITVTAVNDDPTANPDSATVRKNGSVVIFILANDSDVDGGTLTVSSFTQPAHGAVTYSTKNKNFRYTPTRGFTGTDTFTYTVSDGQGGTATATVSIVVQ
jgi:hypothetical protein